MKYFSFVILSAESKLLVEFKRLMSIYQTTTDDDDEPVKNLIEEDVSA